jgi:hypothetical protein
MKIFLCAFGSFNVALPSDSVSSLMLYAGNTPEQTASRDENGNMRVSLPFLFKNNQGSVKHAITLKNNIILLTTEVQREQEIEQEQIGSLPKIFDKFNFSSFFNGMFFISGADEPVLLLNPQKLESIARMERI